MGSPPYSNGVIHVLSEKCSTCVFRPGNLMSLNEGRLKDLVDSNLAQDAALVCHKTTYDQAEQEAICRGFFDSYARDVPALRLAVALEIIKEVES